jgi:hypothetical protein
MTTKRITVAIIDGITFRYADIVISNVGITCDSCDGVGACWVGHLSFHGAGKNDVPLVFSNLSLLGLMFTIEDWFGSRTMLVATGPTGLPEKAHYAVRALFN